MMEPTDPTLIGTVVVLSVTLVELTKTLLSRLNGKKNGNTLSAKEHEALMNMAGLMSKLDQDGVPMVYTKRSYEGTLSDILDVCRESESTQKAILDSLRRMESRISVMPPRRTQ